MCFNFYMILKSVLKLLYNVQMSIIDGWQILMLLDSWAFHVGSDLFNNVKL